MNTPIPVIQIPFHDVCLQVPILHWSWPYLSTERTRISASLLSTEGLINNNILPMQQVNSFKERGQKAKALDPYCIELYGQM